MVERRAIRQAHDGGAQARRAAAWLAVIVLLVSQREAMAQVPLPPASLPRRRVEITFAGGVHYPVRSTYQDTLVALDRSPFLIGATLAARGYTVPRPWLRFGARLGFLRMVSIGPADERAASVAGSDLALNVVDLSGSARLVGLVRNEHDAFRVDATADVGVVFGAATLRNVHQWLVAPLFGISGFVGYEHVPDGVVAGFRMGVQYAPWNGAGGPPLDPTLAGAYMMLELGGIS